MERAITDHDYRTLTRFVHEAASYLTRSGRVLLFFGSTADVAYLDALLDAAPLASQIVATRTIVAHDTEVTYTVYRLCRSASRGSTWR